MLGLRRFVCSQVHRCGAWHTCGHRDCPAHHVPEI